MRRRIAVLLLSSALATFGLVGVPATPAQSCAEIDPAVGCIGPCARPLQGSPTCPAEDGGGKGNGNGNGNGNGDRP